MKIGIIIANNDDETVWNAFRFGNFSLSRGDTVKVFLLGKGVESEHMKSEKFNVLEQMNTLLKAGGHIQACGTCLKIRQSESSDICPLSTMQDMYDIVKDSDRVLTF
jgi:uncharacterized protein involved in oxidation of intracellular sulfur